MFSSKNLNRNMLKNVFVFENIVKNCQVMGVQPPDPRWLWALSQTSAILPSPAVLLQKFECLQKSLFAPSVPSLSSCHEKATVAPYFGRIRTRLGVIILISKILVDFSASSLCNCAPALQLVPPIHNEKFKKMFSG